MSPPPARAAIDDDARRGVAVAVAARERASARAETRDLGAGARARVEDDVARSIVSRATRRDGAGARGGRASSSDDAASNRAVLRQRWTSRSRSRSPRTGRDPIISNRGASGAAARRTEGGSARHRAPRARASLARARRVVVARGFDRARRGVRREGARVVIKLITNRGGEKKRERRGAKKNHNHD